MNQLVKEIEKLVIPLLNRESVELVDVSFKKNQGRWVLCFTLDKEGGISLNDCEEWSHKIEAILDQSDIVPYSYVLEISSPGVNRPLKKREDFERFRGERVNVKLYAPVNGQKNFHGVLYGIEGEGIFLTEENGKDIAIKWAQIAKANLDPVLKF